MAGPDDPKPNKYRYGRQVVYPILKRHCRLRPRTPAQGWPGRTIRSRTSTAKDGSLVPHIDKDPA